MHKPYPFQPIYRFFHLDRNKHQYSKLHVFVHPIEFQHHGIESNSYNRMDQPIDRLLTLRKHLPVLLKKQKLSLRRIHQRNSTWWIGVTFWFLRFFRCFFCCLWFSLWFKIYDKEKKNLLKFLFISISKPLYSLVGHVEQIFSLGNNLICPCKIALIVRIIGNLPWQQNCPRKSSISNVQIIAPPKLFCLI